MLDATEFGAALRAAREEAGLSLKQAAVELGISDNSLGSWELGKRKRRLPRARIERLEVIYGIADERLLRRGGYLPAGSSGVDRAASSLAYGGDPLTPSEEREVRRYIEYLRSRRAD